MTDEDLKKLCRIQKRLDQEELKIIFQSDKTAKHLWHKYSEGDKINLLNFFVGLDGDNKKLFLNYLHNTKNL